MPTGLCQQWETIQSICQSHCQSIAQVPQSSKKQLEYLTSRNNRQDVGAVGWNCCQVGAYVSFVEKRKRCQICTRKRDRKTSIRCSLCFRPVCHEHISHDRVCFRCSAVKRESPMDASKWSELSEEMHVLILKAGMKPVGRNCQWKFFLLLSESFQKWK